MEKVFVKVNVEEISRDDFDCKINNQVATTLTEFIKKHRNNYPSLSVIPMEEVAKRINDECTFDDIFVGVVSVMSIY